MAKDSSFGFGIQWFNRQIGLKEMVGPLSFRFRSRFQGHEPRLCSRPAAKNILPSFPAAWPGGEMRRSTFLKTGLLKNSTGGDPM
jgi:hypothetical protein